MIRTQIPLKRGKRTSKRKLRIETLYIIKQKLRHYCGSLIRNEPLQMETVPGCYTNGYQLQLYLGYAEDLPHIQHPGLVKMLESKKTSVRFIITASERYSNRVETTFEPRLNRISTGLHHVSTAFKPRLNPVLTASSSHLSPTQSYFRKGSILGLHIPYVVEKTIVFCAVFN